MDSLDRIHHVLVIEDPSFHREINLDAATYSIGRHSSNDIVLSCQKTSRNHATLLRRTDVKTNKFSYWVLDGDLQGNRSRNGIYINTKKTLVHELKDGDVIQFSGDARATYKITSDLPVDLPADNSNNYQTSLANSALVNKDTVVNPPVSSVNGNTNSSINTNKPLLVDSSRQISLTELSPQPIIEIDLYGNITYINSAGIIHFKDIHHRKLSHPLLENLISIYHQGQNNIINREVIIGDKTFWQTAHYLPDNKVIRNYIVDISQQKALEVELHYQTNLYNKISQHVAEAIIIVESATKQIIEVNAACSELLGYSREQMLQMNIYELCSASEQFSAILQGIIAAKNSFWGECLLRHQSGEIVKTKIKIDLVSSEAKETICLLISNSIEERQSTQGEQKELVATASEKNIFKQQMVTAISNATRSENLLAVMFCKLYFLPDIRANLGTQKSQELLSTLGKRLTSCIRAGDTVVHWKDDRYVLLMPQINGIEEVAKINSRIKQSVEQSFKLGATNVTLNGSIGIAIYPQDGTNIDILLANANTALERAYNSKKSYQFYNESMNSQASVALELEALLQQALEREEFKLYYQPQINLDTGKTEAIEALLRWQHPEFGLVPPNNFIKSAETTKLIIPIGEWAIRQACSQNKAWQKEGLPPSRITVSLSLVQFKQTNLVAKIAEILAETALEPQFLELEISAVSLLENIELSKTLLQQLKELGVYIAIDDFTAGFSVLEYLKHFPLNTLKIDRSVVGQLTNSPEDLAIATALIELGKGFDLRIVAEGVETQKQVDLLSNLGCKQMQGFWFGRPLEASEASKLLPLNNSNTETIEQMAEALAKESSNSDEDIDNE
ncbi:EAL domain-containing protein [Waterburya agarophytonicola]|nr:EAL domain-containing protein [Waterburya agarophytonicola]